MSEKVSGINWNKTAKVKNRRKGVIERLTLQLKSNTKKNKEGVNIALTDSDNNRINREIVILNERI